MTKSPDLCLKRKISNEFLRTGKNSKLIRDDSTIKSDSIGHSNGETNLFSGFTIPVGI